MEFNYAINWAKIFWPNFLSNRGLITPGLINSNLVRFASPQCLQHKIVKYQNEQMNPSLFNVTSISSLSGGKSHWQWHPQHGITLDIRDRSLKTLLRQPLKRPNLCRCFPPFSKVLLQLDCPVSMVMMLAIFYARKIV